MAYTNVWNDSTPLGTAAANTIDNIFRALKVDIEQRLMDLHGIADFTLDPLKTPYVRVGYGTSTFGGHVRHTDDTGTYRWRSGLAAGAASTSYDITDVVSGRVAFSASATTGIVTLPLGLSIAAGGAAITGNVGITGQLSVSANVNLQAALVMSNGSSILFGNNPATIGFIRLPNNTTIYWRNAANTNNIAGIGLDATDTLILSANTNLTGILAVSNRITTGAGGSTFTDDGSFSAIFTRVNAAPAINFQRTGTGAFTSYIQLTTTGLNTQADFSAGGIFTSVGINRSLGTSTAAVGMAGWRFGDTNSASSRDWVLSNGRGAHGVSVGNLVFSISTALNGDPLAAGASVLILTSAGITVIGVISGNLTGNVTGNVTGNLTGAVTGNASTATLAASATALATPRNINGVAFDGTANITVAAAAGTLTGATLASNVLASSLTSVGTLSSLAVTGNYTSTNGNISLTNGSCSAHTFFVI